MRYALRERIVDRGTIYEAGAVVELTDEQASALGARVEFIALANLSGPMTPPASDPEPTVETPRTPEQVAAELAVKAAAESASQPTKPSSKSEKKQP